MKNQSPFLAALRLRRLALPCTALLVSLGTLAPAQTTDPDFDLSFRVRRDEIRDETTFGASLDIVEF